MARRKPPPQDGAAIVAEWKRSKRADPKLTKADFMMKARPGAYKNRESAAAYLRVLESGKRSGSVLWDRATTKAPGASPNDYQAVWVDRKGDVRSFNLAAPGATNAFANARVEQELKSPRHRAMLERKRREFAQRYSLAEGDFDIDDITVRHVRRHRKLSETL